MSRTDNAPEFATQEVHLWKIPLAVPKRISDKALAVLSQEERARAAGFGSETLRAKWCVGRAALRTILGRYLRCPSDKVLFQIGEHGKPSLLGTPLYFNFSHSGELALLALAYDAELGVDLEFPTQERPFAKLIERFFSPQEAAALQKLPPAEIPAAFYRCWTRKEALLKGIGAGISMPLKSFTVSMDTKSSTRFVMDALTTEPHAIIDRAWEIVGLELPMPYIGALAIRAHEQADAAISPTEGKGLSTNTSLSMSDSPGAFCWSLRFFDF